MKDRLNAIPLEGNPGLLGSIRRYFRATLDRFFSKHAVHAELDDERSARELLRVTLHSIGDAVIVTDEAGRVRTLNPEAERITGWKQDECIGMPLANVFHIVHEQSGAPVESPVDNVLRHGGVSGLASYTVLVAKDGTRIPIDDTASAILGKSGPLQGVVLVFRDVTGARAAERAQTHLAAIVHYSGDAIVTKDLNGIVQTWNAAAEKLFGYRPDEIIGKSITMLLPPERLHEEAEILARLRAGQSSERLETVRVTKDGRRLYVSVNISPLRDRDGHIIGASKIVHDITDRKIAEVALREREETLREVDRRKDEFLAVLSHELRNPLAPIRMAVSLLRRRGSTDPEERALHDVIDRQAAQLARLLEDLLDVNRIRSGKIALRREPINLGDAVSRGLESVAPQIVAKRQELTVDLPQEVVWVNADATRMTQVAANLLSNASKYTGREGHIALSLTYSDKEAVLRVRDSGVGISNEQMTRIFDMFAQASPSLDRSEGGLGVGLAITRMLVELHGGTVEVHSEGAGRGSEFIVRIPALPAPAKHAAAPRPSGAASAVPHRVLVADDNVDSAEMLAEALRELGHEVRVAFDGAATVVEAESFAPDVAFLDIGMPKLNGYDVCRKLRNRFGDSITLVAVTGWGQEADRRRAKEASFDHHLTKPVDLTAVEKLIGNVAGPSPA
jgi:PAS domain S-box-containing protein